MVVAVPAVVLGAWVWLQVCVPLLHGAFGLDLAAEVVAVDDGCRFQAKRINELTQVFERVDSVAEFQM